MYLSKKEQYEQCIALDQEGYCFAKYQNLTLTSVYQPIFDQHLKLVGLEALVRIQNQNKEMLRPDLFFSQEANDCLTKKNVENLSRAIHIRNFHRMNLDNVMLFLNVLPTGNSYSSVKSIANGLLVQRLGELGIGCSRIVLEILEQHTNNDKLKEVTDELKELGFGIAMDDFGKDASDINRASTLKPHIIKIDKSLLHRYMGGDTQELMEGLKLAKTMNAKTVIEGVENETQLIEMQRLGVDLYQGYHLGKPSPSPIIKRMCKSFHQRIYPPLPSMLSIKTS